MFERRLILTALAAVAAAPAFAQTGERSSQMTKDQVAGDKSPSDRVAPQAAMGEAERKHMMDTMAAGSLSLASSRVAVKKARDEDVKEFAQFEVAEQETIADILKSMQEGRASGKIDAPSDSEVRQHIGQQDQVMLQKIEQMQAGDEFDKAYVRAQTDGHQKLLRIQEDYLASGKNAAHLNVVKLARGQIKEHLTLLADLSEDDRATIGQSKSAK